MATTRSALTDEDIRILVKGANPDDRAVAAHKLCRTIDKVELTKEDREKAHEILRIMARDAAELVRRAVAVVRHARQLADGVFQEGHVSVRQGSEQ